MITVARRIEFASFLFMELQVEFVFCFCRMGTLARHALTRARVPKLQFIFPWIAERVHVPDAVH